MDRARRREGWAGAVSGQGPARQLAPSLWGEVSARPPRGEGPGGLHPHDLQ